MDVPEALRYTTDHEWLRLESDEAVVGITAYATEELGDIVFVELPAVGRHLAEGRGLRRHRIGQDRQRPLRAAGGEVLAVNEDLATQPELVNAEPYAAGWMVRLRLDDPAMADGLMDAGAYRAQIGG